MHARSESLCHAPALIVKAPLIVGAPLITEAP